MMNGIVQTSFLSIETADPYGVVWLPRNFAPYRLGSAYELAGKVLDQGLGAPASQPAGSRRMPRETA